MENSSHQSESLAEADRATSQPDATAPPVYEKPVIRKYDQIDQVKPYGPSELEAG
jgi:hypothetical protein